ncbi:phosphatase PAP2 family protein [Tersicoccus sp. MR15.9]|uniref:phosphatase PAP2 family protein n=1 Tax=Tersicoccus mangrovi TaxID=3121635 RepID=UPI002FE5A75D
MSLSELTRSRGRAGSRRTAARPLPVAVLWTGAGLCAAAVFAVYAFFVRTVLGQQLDEAPLTSAQKLHTADDPIAVWLQTLPWFLIAGVLMAIAVVIAVVRRRWAVLIAVLVTIAGSTLTTQFLKYAVFERPDLGLDTLTLNSLPSGHTTAAAAAAAALLLAVPREWRPVFGVAGAAFTMSVAGSTLISYWHRPSDTVAAMAVVGAWTFAAAAFTDPRATRRRGRATGGAARNRAVAEQARLAGLVLFGIAVVALCVSGLLYTGVIPASIAGTGGNLWAGLLFETSAACALFAALTLVLGRRTVLP